MGGRGLQIKGQEEVKEKSCGTFRAPHLPPRDWRLQSWLGRRGGIEARQFVHGRWDRSPWHEGAYTRPPSCLLFCSECVEPGK